MLFDLISIISFLLSVIAIGLSFYFWKNPIESKIFRYIEDEENEISYGIGKRGKGWFVEKKLLRNAGNGKAFKFIADGKNNPNLKEPPVSLNEMKKLNYKKL